jgi:hypothetical protein
MQPGYREPTGIALDRVFEARAIVLDALDIIGVQDRFSILGKEWKGGSGG